MTATHCLLATNVTHTQVASDVAAGRLGVPDWEFTGSADDLTDEILRDWDSHGSRPTQYFTRETAHGRWRIWSRIAHTSPTSAPYAWMFAMHSQLS